MKKTIKNFKKILLAVLISAITFGSTIIDTNAASKTISLGDAKRLSGYVADLDFSTKTTTSGEYLYCLNRLKTTAKNTTAKLVGERDAGIAYIIENGYPNKSITGNANKDYYITQSAVWWYLDDTTGSSNLSKSFKSTGSDNYGLRSKIKKLVSEAKSHKKYATTKLTIKTSDTTMSLKDGYYISEEIYASTISNLSSYKVELTNAPSGTQIINSNNKVTNTIGKNEKFRIKVPASKVTGTKLNIKVTAKATGTVYKAYEYQPTDSKMQNVAKLVAEKTNVSSSVNLAISTSKVTITKIDKATNKALAGAKLVVKDSTGKVVTSWTSTTKSHVITNLSNGTYTVIETEAPKGYLLNNETYKFTITDTNKNITVNFYNEARESVVNIVKVDNTTGEALAGAVLVVRDSNGNEIERFTTTTDPYIITDLENGTYTVEEESAPEGYMLNSEKITFTIDDNNLSHQITFENSLEVYVPDTASSSSLILTILGIAIIGTGIGFVYKNGKKAK